MSYIMFLVGFIAGVFFVAGLTIGLISVHPSKKPRTQKKAVSRK
jgi:hypothetical protein